MFYFCHSKNPEIMKYIMKDTFNSISIYSWKKISLLTNIRYQMCCKENKSLFLTSWKKAKLLTQKSVIFKMITDFFLVEKWGTCKEILQQKLINLDCQDSTCFGIFQVALKWRTIGKSFSFPFSAKYFDINFKCLI